MIQTIIIIASKGILSQGWQLKLFNSCVLLTKYNVMVTYLNIYSSQ